MNDPDNLPPSDIWTFERPGIDCQNARASNSLNLGSDHRSVYCEIKMRGIQIRHHLSSKI
eukprot:12426904-Karenia_brevis.AAC.1